MTKVLKLTFFFVAGAVVLAACSSGPLHTFRAGDELMTNDFSEPATFEEGAYTDATLRVTNGVFRISLAQGDSEVWWAQWGDTYTDTVIDVDINQTSQSNNNAYGVACRLRGHVGQPTAVDPELAAIASGGSVDSEATEEATQEVTQEATSETTAEPAATETSVDQPNGDGYLFMMRGSGSVAILRSRGRSIDPLVDWNSVRSGSSRARPEQNARHLCR